MSSPSLNFQQAVYEGDPAGPDQCAYCQRSITDAYYRVSGNLACTACAEQAQSLTPPNAHSAFLHALSYGAAAAVVGCIGYALVVILTGWEIGYAAIGVGYLIGWAMRKAAKEHGGRRYQWAAALLTYAAVSMAFVPIAIHASLKEKAPVSATQQGNASANSAKDTTAKTEVKPLSGGGFALALVEFAGLGLISPFMELSSSIGGGLLSLFIIFIGMRFAWQQMATPTISVEGPFESNARPQHHSEDGAATAL